MSDEFPGDQWPRLKELMECGGAAAVVEFVRGHDDPVARRKLYLFAVGAFGQREWKKDMDAVLVLAHAGIDDSLSEADAETEVDARNRRIELANVLAYNMGANMADCWDDPDAGLERRHFEAGLALAERCLAWRETLEKGPYPFSIAWWLKGMHEISLGSHDAALASLKNSLRFARRHAEAEQGVGVTAHQDFGIALGEGYLGIAEHLAQVEGGHERFEAALTDFETMAADPDKKDDAQFGASQLRTVWNKYCDE